MAAFLVDNDLHDLGFVGPRFTWMNNKVGNNKIWVRLDRILMNSEGIRIAPLSTIKHMVRLATDHCPLLLNLASSVVAKILINRLKPVLGNIISQEQGAFVPGRSISSHGLLAQEMMNKFQFSAQKSGMMVLKIDMEQAYDCMSWDTLHRVMTLMGFSGRFIEWIIQCIAKPRFSLLLNGNRMPWIYAESGLRQGCPLSSYLFILYFELLTKAFRHRGQLGVQVVKNVERISHLLYEDDILVFAEASKSNALRIMKLVDDYCDWSGQRINCEKSVVLFSRRCPKWKKRTIAKLMGYRKVISLDYLGLPLVMRRLKVIDFYKIIRNAHQKTNIWGKKHLSLAGRAVLIRTSLLSIPMYLMSHTKVPRGVLGDIKKLGRGFLWQKDSNSRGMHYVGWKEMCQPRDHRGLGFHGLTN
ncbi:Putative ribonuclease H protein [Dendrobium catenatum]|uniref:Ribonuclease H protein n=1 Tax=Dendrobium catenatum TaxID=906689 RepID=A0A2I0VPU3_9ASPA|nr:Putative ribonuclease H protein [Dendrobium catenatum]